MKKELICIVCPLGCNITVDTSTNTVCGNNCPRGKEYALSECISPMRVITTTVRCKNGKMIPVKTSRPIPKEKIFEYSVDGIIEAKTNAFYSEFWMNNPDIEVIDNLAEKLAEAEEMLDIITEGGVADEGPN